MIISTKLHPPPIRPGLVKRPRLMECLNLGVERKLTMVSAPAGYGKSTLLGEWVHQINLPTAWLTLDQDDNDVTRFLLYTIQALRKVNENIGEVSLAILETPKPSPPHIILTALVNELNNLHLQIALVLDDYHVIVDNTIHEALVFLLDHLPEFINLVILTRADPPLQTARLRAQNQLVEIRADDLRFTSEEATAFLNSTMGLGLSPDKIRALEEHTEGWITGLQLVALSLQDLDAKQSGEFINAFTGSHHYIVDYLVEEVLNRQPDPVRNFLLRTSILERMTGALCDALTGEAGGHARLENLAQRDLFIIPLDEQRQWYRYHHLLAEVLRSRVQSSHPDLIPELHQRASIWFEENGPVGDAIRHAISAGNKERGAELVEQNAMSMMMRGEFVTLLNWIEPIEDIASNRPWLSIYKSWAYTLTGKLDLTDFWLQTAERGMSSSDVATKQDMRGHIEAIHAHIASLRGEASHSIEHAQRALKLLPEDDLAVRSIVTFTLGTAFRLSGDPTRARKALENVRRAGHLVGNRYLELGALSSLSAITYGQGKLHQALEIDKEVLQLSTQPGGQMLPTAVWAFFGLGLIHYEWNDLDTAQKNTQRTIELCQQWGDFTTLAESLVLLSQIKQAQGDLQSAEQALQKAEDLTQLHAIHLVEHWVKAIQARLWLAQGNLEAAKRWAQESGIKITDEYSHPREAEYLSLGRVFLATEEFDQALELTQMVQKATEAAGRMGSLIDTLLLRALASQAKKDLSQALISLEQAITLAQPEGYIRVFINAGAPMVRLLRHAGSQGIASHYVAKLISEFDRLPEEAIPTTQPLIEPLSKREFEVVQLLANGLSNLEIADTLVITVGTVKAHTASIYRKLNVNNRMQAAARVRELNLI